MDGVTMLFCMLLVSSLSSVAAQGQNQPIVTTIESFRASRSAGIVSLPEGSPWCFGNPTAWFPGHHNHEVDTPSCLINGTWSQPNWATMDINDELNARDGEAVLDRHACGVIDANNDGRMDFYCLIGANNGAGRGFNELYLTRPNGKLRKIRRHGLQTISSMRTRETLVLQGPNNTEFVFVTTVHGERKDGRPNQHRMYKKTGIHSSRFMDRYFELFSPELQPWRRPTDGECAIKADVNGDGLDDLIVCNGKVAAHIIVQDGKGGFIKNIPNKDPWLDNWRGARTADFNGDGLLDLAVVYRGFSNSVLRVFKGIPERPYFNFAGEYFSMPLEYAAPDLEVFDSNNDGHPDIYIVQDDQVRRYPNGTSRSDVYCGGIRHIAENWWSGGPNRITPPADYRPPNDEARDVLLLGNPMLSTRFRRINMRHSEPGCGYRVKKFGERSLLLAQGSFDRPGHQLLLDWDK